MVKPFFKVGQEVFLVKDFKVLKVKIEEIVIRITDKQRIEYNVSCVNFGAEGKKNIKTYPEAYLVKNFEIAKQSALKNWENITKNIQEGLVNMKKEDFEVKVDDTEKSDNIS